MQYLQYHQAVVCQAYSEQLASQKTLHAEYATKYAATHNSLREKSALTCSLTFQQFLPRFYPPGCQDGNISNVVFRSSIWSKLAVTMSKFQSWSDMAHNDNDHSNFMRETYNRLNTLCQIPPSSFDPSDNTKRVGLISDGDIEEIAHCLRDLDFEDACDRPRTFAILYMMNRQDLLPAFKIAGRLDNAFPYVDRPSLPPSMRKDGEASRRFLELQSHVMSTACAMEKGVDGPHVLTESGDMFFKSLGVLGKGGEA